MRDFEAGDRESRAVGAVEDVDNGTCNGYEEDEEKEKEG